MALQERLRSMDLGYLLGYLIPGEMKCFLMKHRYEWWVCKDLEGDEMYLPNISPERRK